VRAVSKGQTDIGIVAGLVRTEDLQVLAYHHDRLVLVVPRGYAPARTKSISFADTPDYDHIGLHESRAILPESAARRHAQTMAIAIVPLADPWAERALQIVVRKLEALPAYARELVDLLVEDAKRAQAS